MVANAPVSAVAAARQFVPRQFDPADWSQIEPLAKKLLDRPIDSPTALEKFLLDFSELISVLDEYRARRYIDMSCHTDDDQIEKRYLHYVEQIEPKLKPLDFALKKKFLTSPHRVALKDRRYEMLIRDWQADVELFRDQNVPIETELTRLVTEYDKLSGAMMVSFRGREYTLQQLARFLEKPDRPLREEAWRASTARRLRDREALEKIFDQMLPLRQRIAQNAGLGNYRDYIWKEKKRFDYTPQDCLNFADAVAETVVPLQRRIDQERARDLKLPMLRPWDLSVDPQNRPPLEPFAEKDIAALLGKTKEIFNRLSPQLSDQFDSLRRNGNLDLDSRKGKAPGGYQESLSESRQPFIFMNAAGVQRDVETLLHEGGHAFHALAAAGEPLVFLRHAPMEFCEVASMAMELFGAEHLDSFYSPADHARARRRHLEWIVSGLAWIALIDSFQHWIYTHPGHSRDERKAEWLRLRERFGHEMDWTGLDEANEYAWEAQLHLFHVPFYYIEYGIAQLGALQLWLKTKEDPQRALNNYRAALKLGGTRPLPELFAAAGIRFDFTAQTLRPLMSAIEDELAALPR